MLIGELIQRVQSAYSKGVQSDDSRLRPRHIYSKLLGARATLIEREFNKKQTISQFSYMTLPCVRMVLKPAHACPIAPPLGCSTYRSDCKIPAPMSGMNGHLIQSVTSLDGNIVFSELNWKGRKYKKGNKFTAIKPEFYFRDGYLWVTDREEVPGIVALIYLPEDPIAAADFCEEDCYDCGAAYDYDMAVKRSTGDTMVEMAVQELLNAFNSSTEDVTNNSQDSAAPQPTK